MSKPICDACGHRIKSNTAMVVVNTADEPTRRYHGQCFQAAPEPPKGQRP
jgi:hypothetical protein